jgi:hypothetical protein
MRGFFVFSTIFFLSSNAYAYLVNSIEIKSHKALQGKMHIQLELGKSLYRSAGEITQDLDSDITQIQLNNTENITNIKYNLFIDSDINVEKEDTQSAIISGKIKLKGSKRKLKRTGHSKEDIEILTYHKMNPKIKCNNVMQVQSSNQKLIIDMSSFKNISDCSGEDLAHYSIDGIGKRNIADGKNRYSLEDDKRLGKEFVDQYEKENQETLLAVDHPMTKFMQAQMEKIALNSDMPQLKPRVRVINADVMNAFALPGGYVYVFRGLLERAPDLNAVMGVLGHEWAHVTARHGTRGMTRARRTLAIGLGVAAVGIIGAEFIDDEKELLKKVVQTSSVALGLGGAQLYILDRGREQELEADRIGSQYAARAGFAPTGIASMFREFKRISPGETTTLEKMLSSHPHHDERIDKNLILSSLFYGKVNLVNLNSVIIDNEEIFYDDALLALSEMEFPEIDESESIASNFVQTLHNQNETILMQDVKAFMESLSEESSETEKAIE